MFRFPSKTNALAFLNSIGVEFGSILDVGTHAETPELRAAFPTKRHILFEPAEEFFPRIAANYSGLNFELVPVAVSDVDGVGRLRKVAISDNEISHSMLDFSPENPEADAASPVKTLGRSDIKTIRLDTFMKHRTDPQPYLLKIDVDGYEVPILRGAEGIWDRIDCVIIEATADTFLERFQEVAKHGFHLFDIIETCYYAGVFSQADLVFVSDRLRRANPRLRPWETESFAWEKWVPITSYEGLARAGSQVPHE
ncbi:MAG: FkbM family methyltransferase [Beijerinckiaceae bacterium]|nr:FkbM family methyltransferase [Beijerinckiaceae bacterium]